MTHPAGSDRRSVCDNPRGAQPGQFQPGADPARGGTGEAALVVLLCDPGVAGLWEIGPRDGRCGEFCGAAERQSNTASHLDDWIVIKPVYQFKAICAA